MERREMEMMMKMKMKMRKSTASREAATARVGRPLRRCYTLPAPPMPTKTRPSSARPAPAKKAYAAAGVDVDLGNQVKSRIHDRVKITHGPEVLGKIGGFGGLFRPNFKG